MSASGEDPYQYTSAVTGKPLSGPESFARVSTGIGEGAMGRVGVPTGEVRSARITLDALQAIAANDFATLGIEEEAKEAVAETETKKGGGEDEEMGDGAGAGGLSGTAVLGEDLEYESLAGTPYDLTGSSPLAALTARVVGESLSAGYSAVTHEEVKRFLKELLGALDTGVDALEIVTQSAIALFMDVVGKEGAEVTVDTLKKTKDLFYWLLKGVGGTVILGLSVANFAAGTGAGLAKAGAGGIANMGRWLRSNTTQNNATKTIIENSPLAIATAIAVFNQLGMLPLMTIGSMVVAGIQQQATPMGRSTWLIYLFKWWVTRSKEEKEEIRAYTKEVAKNGAYVAAEAAGKGAVLAADKATKGAKLVAAAIQDAYKAAKAKPPADIRELEAKAKLARVAAPGRGAGAGAGSEDRAAAQALAEQTAVMMGVLELEESEVGEGATKLAQLKKGVARAIERVGAKKGGRSPAPEGPAGAGAGAAPVVSKFRAPGFGAATASVPSVPVPAEERARVPYDLRRPEERGRGAGAEEDVEMGRAQSVERGRRKGVGTELGPARSSSLPKESAAKRKKGGPSGGKRTKKAKRKTYRKKKRMMKKTRKFIY